MTMPAPAPIDLSIFTDEQLAMLLNIGGQARYLAGQEIQARQHTQPDDGNPSS